MLQIPRTLPALQYGLDPGFSLAAFARALRHGHNTTHVIEGASEGMLVQNASLIAQLISDFIGQPQPLVGRA